MRLRTDERRDRILEDAQAALDESTKSEAIIKSCKYVARMAGGTTAIPEGKIAQLLAAAEEAGSLTGEEIADILDTEEIAVDYSTSTSWSVETGDE
jgi:hypothetical protein